MKRILELFTHRIVVLVSLVVFCGPVYLFRIDPRIGIAIMSIIFLLHGLGRYDEARRDPGEPGRAVSKWLGIFFIAVSVLFLVMVTLLFVFGRGIEADY